MQPTLRNYRGTLAAALAAAFLVAGFILGVSYGSTPVPFGQVWATVRDGVIGTTFEPGNMEIIVWQVRIPRPILAMIVGAGLGVVGVAVQALVRNDLADPFLLGISSGASVGAVWVLVFGGGGVGGAFGPTRLILTGVTVGQILAAITSFLVLQTDDQAQTRSVLFWLMGSLGGATWSQLPVTAAAIVLGSLALVLRARHLNALAMGDETASDLGISVNRLRREVFVIVSLMTGVVVAVSGAIGFVGRCRTCAGSWSAPTTANSFPLPF
ncbi:FecCD family ABC transporter permease [Rhodococcus jostii]|uniref:FecCD family ABC transporter permease n=1 Tax=Rhodococcus jostii TaxID=132919 RepID=UPI0036285158